MPKRVKRRGRLPNPATTPRHELTRQRYKDRGFTDQMVGATGIEPVTPTMSR